MAAISPYSYQPRSTAVHEVTHQFQKAMRHEPGMQTAFSTIRQQTPVSGLARDAFERYKDNTLEIHARLMEVRHELGYKPWEVITQVLFMNDIAKHPKAFYTWMQYPNQVVDWLNKAPSVALSLAGGAGAAVVGSQQARQ